MNNLIKNRLLTPFNLLYKISPELTLKILFRLKCGYKLNLKNPVTFNEKLQWIKLNDRNPLMPVCCDKYAVREYVKSKGCGDTLNDLLWEGFNPEEIPFDDLPKQYVIKVTHGSTFNIIVTDSDKLDRQKAVRDCKKWLKTKFLPCYGEWYYGIEKPRVIIEKYLNDGQEDGLVDYKVFCFKGKAKTIGVHCGRYGTHKQNFFDTDWNLLDAKLQGINSKYGDITGLEKPAVLTEMLNKAELLSVDFLHARIDFYIVENKIYFGEITFSTASGFSVFSPHDFDIKMGKWLDLPLK